MQGKSVYIAIDLGSDTLKVVYAYKDGGAERVGKIVSSDFDITAIPAVAKYDEDDGKWLYASDVNRDKKESYVTVVKIKDLLSMLSELRSKNILVRQRNSKYYFEGNDFPKFFFPVKPEEIEAFDKMVKGGRTFCARGYTPHTVCAMYFKSVAKTIRERLNVLLTSQGISSYELNWSLVTPPHVGDKYINELVSLVSKAFSDAQRGQVLSMTKALSIYAMKQGLVKDESALIFNIGEEKTFVVKAHCIGGGLSIDGVDGHEGAEDLGGNDIDNAVATYLESKMEGHPIIGRPSAGSEGYVNESGLYSKQYLFLKNIKAAKIILGINAQNGTHPEGVPISVSKELVLKMHLTYDEFAKCVGVRTGDGFAGKLFKYIQRELSRGVNSDVKKIFLTGGVVETHGVVGFIEKKLAPKGISVLTFENPSAEIMRIGQKNFNIYSHEDALYAPCIGCAMSTMNNIKVDTVTALTYGLRLFRKGYANGHLRTFIYKGTKLKDGDNFFLLPNIIAGDDKNPTCDSAILVLSTHLSKRDIDSGKYSYVSIDGVRCLDVGDLSRDSVKKEMERSIGLRAMNDGLLVYKYDGLRVVLGPRYGAGNRLIPEGAGARFNAGVVIDGTGKARVYAENNKQTNAGKRVTVSFIEGNAKHRKGESMTVDATEVEFSLSINFDAK